MRRSTDPLVARVDLEAADAVPPQTSGQTIVDWEAVEISEGDGVGTDVTTLRERKETEARRRKRACDAAIGELRAYGFRHDGRFVVFGSYVDDTMRFDSDLDILVDFPAAEAAEAWRFAEDVCARQAVPPDLHDARTTTAAFVARVLGKGLVLS